MPQVFVMGKAYEFGPNETVLQVLTKVLEHLKKLDDVDKVALLFNSVPLPNDALMHERVGDKAALTLGLSKEYQAQLAQARDPVAWAALQLQLTGYLTNPPMETYVLVSIASYVHSDHDEQELRKQQFPSEVVKLCTDRKLALSVILADPGFAEGQAKQIYDGSGWKSKFIEEKGRVRQYEFSGEPSLACTLRAYATNVEWTPGKPMTTMAEVELAKVREKLNEAGGELLVRLYNGDIIYPLPGPDASKGS